MEDMEAFVSSTASNAAYVAKSAAANKQRAIDFEHFYHESNDNFTVFGYEIQLNNPYIIAPKHATSNEELQIDLGLIYMYNIFQEHQTSKWLVFSSVGSSISYSNN